MVADSVAVALMHPCREGKAGDTVDMSQDRARLLVDRGVARYATRPDAKKAGGDPDKAATAKK